MAGDAASDREAPPEIDPQNPPFPLNDTDKKVLAIRDEDWKPITWPQLKEIIATNTLEKLQRSPLATRQYLAWSASIKSQYGSTLPYITSQKLRWKPSPNSDPPTFPSQSPTPFASRQDYAILPNDWPYSFTPDITHLLVWTKTPIATDDAEGGDVTAESRRLIDGFVERNFARKLGEGGGERVLWFKNWTGLQSVRALDHVHVLVRDVPAEVLEGWLERRDLE
ncbi:hypothetical protein B0A54_17847 [Friedmanniomyces endolithicus]|uniref:N-acetylglucosamine-induced protein 1 n=1 Tax=Friedmanniomyces endolithicus TaxID=329885 RepID=A0A4U0TNS3_9PEZI|nr:hypothetical protein LTS09_018040 [Friedmanniomyces endolithicus]TKA23577.1 hypothetical protein B0A54_17847 [Friedmanniomyces endolithicus]